MRIASHLPQVTTDIAGASLMHSRILMFLFCMFLRYRQCIEFHSKKYITNTFRSRNKVEVFHETTLPLQRINVELKRNNIKRPPLPECCQHKARHQWHGGPKTNANGKKGCRPTYRPAQLVSHQRARANVLFHTVNTETPTSTFTSRAQEEPSPIP